MGGEGRGGKGRGGEGRGGVLCEPILLADTHTAAGSCLFLSTASCERPSSKHPSDHCTREGGYLRKGGRVGGAYKHSWLGEPSSKQLYVCYCHTLPNSPYLQL